MEETQSARVVRVGRNHVWLVLDTETQSRTGEMRKTQAREMLVPGDRVLARLREDGSAFVDTRLPRTSTLERVTKAGRRKTMAANITMVAVAVAHAQPAPNWSLVDEVLAFAGEQQLKACLIFSKADLSLPAAAAAAEQLYRGLGYAVARIDARSGEGVADVSALLADNETLLMGASGVGKSTLFRALGGEAVIGEVSERTGRGKQTTSSGRLHRLPSGTLIDSPGIGEFALEGLDPANIAALWVEIAPLLGQCRFLDCRHHVEPGCALLRAVAAGAIAPGRWQTYRRAYERLLEDAKHVH